MYGIISDTHCHNWSQFSSINEDGVNSRLRFILNEIERAADMVAQSGGKTLFHAGDLFHVRGYIAPSVLNPTMETFERILRKGITPIILCGNHDAEFRETNDLGSAIGALRSLGCKVFNEPSVFETDIGPVVGIPWIRNNEEFLKVVGEYAKKAGGKADLICHVALNGVFGYLDGSVCVNPDDVFKVGDGNIRRIFAGHLHNHKEISPDVYSIGAIAQHNWGDSASKAGFMLVGEDKAEFIESTAPKFVTLTGAETSTDEMSANIRGNYVRANLELDEAEVKKFRKLLTDNGALGITLIADAKPEPNLKRMEIQTTESLETIVARYIEKNLPPHEVEAVKQEALSILSEVEL